MVIIFFNDLELEICVFSVYLVVSFWGQKRYSSKNTCKHIFLQGGLKRQFDSQDYLPCGERILADFRIINALGSSVEYLHTDMADPPQGQLKPCSHAGCHHSPC